MKEKDEIIQKLKNDRKADEEEVTRTARNIQPKNLSLEKTEVKKKKRQGQIPFNKKKIKKKY